MRLAIFDVDGTLVDSQNVIVEAQRQAFTALKLEPPSRERALSIVGLSLAEAFTVLAGADGPVEALVEGYKQAFQHLRVDPAYHEPLFPGAAETLDALGCQPGAALGIATGKSRRGVAYLIQRHGWEGRFATIQTADDAPSKPHPAMLLQAMAEAGAEPAETIMIGDSTFDMQMARDAGVRAIGVSWGYHRPDALLAVGAETIVESYAALRTLLLPASLES